MIRVGFICEGATEKKIIESENTRTLLKSLHIELIIPVIDATGKTNLSRNKINPYIDRLKANGAEKIVVITDQDKDCITKTKDAIGRDKVNLIAVAVKQIEAWLLADSDCMRAILSDPEFHCDSPEEPLDPYKVISDLLVMQTRMGARSKLLLVAKCINHKFSITKAAQHPNCNSAKYFIEKLRAFHVEH